MSKAIVTKVLTKLVILSFAILISYSSVLADKTSSQDFHAEERYPKQLSGFFEWLFGPPVTKSNKVFATSTSPSIIYHQLSRFKNNSRGGSHLNKNVQSDSPGNLDTAEIHQYQLPSMFNADTNTSTSQINNSFNTNLTESVLPKPKPRNARREFSENFGPIQITDIQHAVGTEINEEDLNSDPGQINFQEELNVIDRLEKNLTMNSRKRQKRESSSKFRQLSIPYGHNAGGGSSISSKNRISTLSKRQLLISPAEQQMFALRQQELAAASMFQPQSLINPYNRYNRYIDDYYDDDSSYEDSDEYYDHFNRNGLHPMMQVMRHGVRIPQIQHPYGIGRRSLPDNEGADISSSIPIKQGRTNSKRFKSVGVIGDSYLGPISKGGRWGTIEDYDLSSDFSKITRRKGMAPRSGGRGSVGERHKELTSRVGEINENGRSSLGLAERRQDLQDVNISTSSSTVPTEIITSIPLESSATESPNHGETTPILTDEEGTESSNEHEDTTVQDLVTTTSVLSSTVLPDSEEQTTTSIPISSLITETTPKPTTSKPKPNSSTVKPQPANLLPYHQTLNCRCGMQSVRGHDIGDGTIVRAMVNPWLVAVRTNKKHLCSGSIINNKYILTSKSCVQGVKGLIVTAGMGSGIPKNFSVIRVNEHATRNIALLKVKPAIAPNFAMRPICLPLKHQDSDRSINTGTATLVTFKKDSPRGSSGLQLVQTEVPMLSNTKCINSAGDSGSGSICPGPPGSMKCGGDVGGLLQIYHKGYSYEQIGVVSTTVGCRANKTPGVYTDTKKSVKWILYNTKDARYCRKPKVSPQYLINSKKPEAESDINEFEDEEEEELQDWSNADGEEEEEWAESDN